MKGQALRQGSLISTGLRSSRRQVTGTEELNGHLIATPGEQSAIYISS